jgi:outer membrane protein OmpA-like peptidoglycan-associated protein
MYKTAIYILLILPFSCVRAQKATDTFRLFFDLGVPTLNKKMEKKIDLLIYNDKILTGSNVTIVGYADYLGTGEYNQTLSMKRAENVKEYLVKYGVREKDITLCVGKGEVDRNGRESPGGYPRDRRVDIVMDNYTGKKTASIKPKRPDTIRKINVTDINEIKRLRPGTIFKLHNVYFPADRHVMKPESHEALEKLYTVLKNNPKIKISIEGHVCCIHDAPDALDIDTYEPYLSVNRAKAIYKYLVDKGIDPSRLTYAGFGRRRPVVDFEQNEEDADKNRRVEIRITEN